MKFSSFSQNTFDPFMMYSAVFIITLFKNQKLARGIFNYILRQIVGRRQMMNLKLHGKIFSSLLNLKTLSSIN